MLNHYKHKQNGSSCKRHLLSCKSFISVIIEILTKGAWCLVNYLILQYSDPLLCEINDLSILRNEIYVIILPCKTLYKTN